MINAEKSELTASGVSPLEIMCYDILSCPEGKKLGRFTEVRVNSLELGALYPAQYRIVTNRNNQSVRLATWAFRRLAEETDSSGEDGFTSFYIPAKLLMRDQLKKLLEGEAKKGRTDFSRLVAEVSSEILYEDAEVAAAKMNELRSEYGIRFLLSEFGDEYCPVLRLPLYPVDYVLFDATVDSPEALGSPAASAALKIAKQCGKTVIARLALPQGKLPAELAPDCCIPALAAGKRRDS